MTILARLAAAMLMSLPLVLSASGSAVAYPDRPVRIIVPYPPGGGTDVVARLLAQRLTERMKQQFIVENRGGAGGTIGTDVVAKAAADGHTLMVVPTSHVINPNVYAKLPYDTRKDFAPVSLLASATIMLAVNPAVPAKTVAELVALARPGGPVTNFGSAGNGTVFHLVGELFKKLAGLQIVHVPYRGGAPTVNALLANEVPMAFETALALGPHVAAGKLRALAVTQPKRSSAWPDIPTTAEAGYPSLEADNAYALFAPAGTPAVIVERLAQEARAVFTDPDMKAKLAEQGAEVVASSPAELAAYVDREMVKWSAVAREAGVRPE
ncbi:tripartite tricarboxylate transporter substrate binding protein [Reyranella sp.]|uniref:tripartite tricarboxylate transporter substrate binding protein n=1 Tax=Reyranella sp. TaxID=1929291 RepID=UPI003BA87982